MSKVKIDLLADWTEIQLRELTNMGYAVGAADTPEQISLAFYNVQRREILPRRRTVHQSRELTCPSAHRAGLNVVFKKAARGQDLRPHQSTRLAQADYNDALLNDWRIQHFHLGSIPYPKMPKFVARTGPVLFAYVAEGDFFAIDVMTHNDFARQRLLEIVHRNWPDLIERHRLKGVLAKEAKCSDDDVKRVRIGHVVTTTEIDGIVYAPPGGGYSSSGTSIEVGLQHDHAYRTFSNIEKYISEHIDQIVENARQRGRTMVPPFNFQLHLVCPDRIEVKEMNSATIFPFPITLTLGGHVWRQ